MKPKNLSKTCKPRQFLVNLTDEEKEALDKLKEKRGCTTQGLLRNIILKEIENEKEAWIVFCLNGKEIGGYTVRGTFGGEIEATKGLLASEHGCNADDIEAREVMR